MKDLKDQLIESNRNNMFIGKPQVMTIAYTKQFKNGNRKALRFITKWKKEHSFINDWVEISKNQINVIKKDTKKLKSVIGYAVLTNKTGSFEDWKLELIYGKI